MFEWTDFGKVAFIETPIRFNLLNKVLQNVHFEVPHSAKSNAISERESAGWFYCIASYRFLLYKIITSDGCGLQIEICTHWIELCAKTMFDFIIISAIVLMTMIVITESIWNNLISAPFRIFSLFLPSISLTHSLSRSTKPFEYIYNLIFVYLIFNKVVLSISALHNVCHLSSFPCAQPLSLSFLLFHNLNWIIRHARTCWSILNLWPNFGIEDA